MQSQLRQNLTEKARLAELGEAVSKINHDLRNMLATAQLSSDALSHIEDPRVHKVTDRMVRATSRAVALCERTLKHGKVVEPDPIKEDMDIHHVIEEVGQALNLENSCLTFDNQVGEGEQIRADADQIFRVLFNLCRNAQDVQPECGLIQISLNRTEEGDAHLFIKDEGPGIAPEVEENLFKPFISTTRKDGTGLGLSIAREITNAHGGRLMLKSTSDEGSVFMLCLPAGDYKL